MGKSRSAGLGLLTWLAFAVSACVTAPAIAQEVLRVPLLNDIGSFDPDNGFEIGALSAINNVYEGLVEYVPGSTRVTGLLAKSWTVSEDDRTYTFSLQPDVTFHDGTPFDAQAVKTSIERRRDGNLLLSYFVANVASIDVIDTLTVAFTLAHPQPSFLDALASAWGPKIVSPTALSAHDAGDHATGWFAENAVGTGPYRLTKFQRGTGYKLERYDAYWGARPFFDEVRLPLVPDIGQQILQLQAGEIDAVPDGYPVAQLASLAAGIEVTTAPSLTQFDLFAKPGTQLEDRAIREAVMAAVNPARWYRDVFGAHSALSLSPYQNAMLAPEVPVAYPVDLNAARQTISERGPLKLTIGLPSEVGTHSALADLLAVELQAIGVEASVNVMPMGASYAMRGDANAPDLLLTVSNPDSAHPDNQASVYYTSDAVMNFYGRALPEIDELITQASRLTGTPERDALYEKAGHMLFEAGFVFPLVDVDDVVVHVSGLTDLGLRPAFPQGNIDFGTVRRAN